MADVMEYFYKMVGDEEGLKNYTANRDYRNASKQNDYLRTQTELNMSFNGLFPSFNSTDFAGVSNFDALKAAITKYSQNVQDAVDEYKAKAPIESTFKGKAGEELHSFVEATKGLLDAYVKLIEQWNDELDSAYERYQQGDVQLQQNVASDTQAVQQAAQNVSLG